MLINVKWYKEIVDSVLYGRGELVLLKELQKYYFQRDNVRDNSIFGHNLMYGYDQLQRRGVLISKQKTPKSNNKFLEDSQK